MTVVRTALGTYDITWADFFPKFIAGIFSFQAAVAVDKFMQISSVNNATRTITVKLIDSTPTAVNPVGTNVIHGKLIFSYV